MSAIETRKIAQGREPEYTVITQRRQTAETGSRNSFEQSREKPQAGRETQKVMLWIWNTFLIIVALCVLFVALVFSAIEVSMGWVAKKLFDLTERIK